MLSVSQIEILRRLFRDPKNEVGWANTWSDFSKLIFIVQIRHKYFNTNIKVSKIRICFIKCIVYTFQYLCLMQNVLMPHKECMLSEQVTNLRSQNIFFHFKVQELYTAQIWLKLSWKLLQKITTIICTAPLLNSVI